MSDITRAITSEGGYHFATFYKPAVPTTGRADVWLDLSASSGYPKYNAYVGSQYEATQLNGVGNDGIYSGPSTSVEQEKRLLTWGTSAVGTSAPLQLILCDYLMFYPLIDLDSSDEQVLSNSVSLPRYQNGEGVYIMLVGSVASTAAGDISITYENSKGLTRTITQRILASNTGWIMTTADTAGTANGRTPFVKLFSGDTGVKRIVSITVLNPIGGFLNAVLVKPLAQKTVYEPNTYSELTFVNDKMTFPKIENNAYLSIVSHNQNSGALSIRSDFTFIMR